MTTSMMHCVLRNLSANGGSDEQFVPVREVPFLSVGETIFAGTFDSQTERHGPSGSDERTVCMPMRRNALHEMKASACVLRDLGDGTGAQYVPVSEAANLTAGERMLVAVFSGQKENHGPSRSHRITVCTPVSRMFETAYAA